MHKNLQAQPQQAANPRAMQGYFSSVVDIPIILTRCTRHIRCCASRAFDYLICSRVGIRAGDTRWIVERCRISSSRILYSLIKLLLRHSGGRLNQVVVIRTTRIIEGIPIIAIRPIRWIRSGARSEPRKGKLTINYLVLLAALVCHPVPNKIPTVHSR